MLLSALFSGMFMASNVTHQKKTESKLALTVQFIHKADLYTQTEMWREGWQTSDKLGCVSRSPDVPPFISPSPGYTSGTAGWRRFTQWSSSTVSSPAHRSLSRCPQGRTSSGTVWLWSPSAPPNTSASLTWSLVCHKSSLERFRHGRANQIVLQMQW